MRLGTHLEAGGLGWQHGPSSNSADLDGWHGAGDVEVLPGGAAALQQSDAVRAGNVLSRVLEWGGGGGRGREGRGRRGVQVHNSLMMIYMYVYTVEPPPPQRTPLKYM